MREIFSAVRELTEKNENVDILVNDIMELNL